ncbi:heparan-alpha-glucosaminide N-acetyltransferase-like [Macrobrachium nipponense]|uniref:heparan-alpha-glucosaminide N-acetyltransferase-like n=1 Tax=Macrobrachium nipponense TaxID=159736 RepID=UPI0030C893C0
MGGPFIEDPGADEFEGFDLTRLKVDQAYLKVTSSDSRNLSLYTLSGDCYGCPAEYSLNIWAGDEKNVTLSTKYPWTFVVSETYQEYLPLENASTVCTVSEIRLGEFGVYEFNIESEGNVCRLSILKEPVFEYGALVIAAAVYTGIALLYALLSLAYKKGVHTYFTSLGKASDSQVVLSMGASTEEVQNKPPARQRLKSLDTFRGISIVVMIFVNYGAGQYWFMEHATWNGLQVADLVFPWFMWIMGVCIPMGLRSAIRRKTPKTKIFLRILKRSIKLFMLGIILNSLGGWVELARYRIPGVLQRFGICYLVVSTVALIFSPQEPPQYQSNAGIFMSDVIQIIPQWVVHIVIVIAHTLITFLLPVPGCPTGYIGPGGIDLIVNGTGSPNCIGGAAGEVDRFILTSAHLYQNPTAKQVYHAGAFDPEGVLGSMTSVFQVFLGLQAGMTLQAFKSHRSRIIRWLVWAVITGIIGAGLCSASMNDGVIPLNKNLWSLSFVMVTSCFAFLLLSVCYVLVDIIGVWTGAPFFQAGMNSIFLYVGHNVAYNLFPWHYKVGSMNTHLQVLAETLWGTTLWVLIGLYLFYKKKFYTV